MNVTEKKGSNATLAEQKQYPAMNNENNNQIMEAFNKFLEFFAPAAIDTATDFFTTGEIIKAIRDIYPVEISPDEIVRLMKENNFDYLPEPNKFSLSLKWITKRI